MNKGVIDHHQIDVAQEEPVGVAGAEAGNDRDGVHIVEHEAEIVVQIPVEAGDNFNFAIALRLARRCRRQIGTLEVGVRHVARLAPTRPFPGRRPTSRSGR